MHGQGVQGVIIESAGLAEVGKEGLELQDQCVAIAKQADIHIWGPNCMGMVDVPHKFFFWFLVSRRTSRRPASREGLAHCPESSMMSAIFLAEVSRRGVGIAKACSIGNRTVEDECDVLGYLLKDPDTDVIAMYIGIYSPWKAIFPYSSRFE